MSDREEAYDADRFPVEKGLSRYEHTCSYCGEPHVIPKMGGPRFWADEMKGRLEDLWMELDRAIEDLQDMFPGVPIEEYMEERCRRLRRGVELSKKALDEELTLQEECELENILDEFAEE